MDTKLTKNKILKDLEKYIIFILVIFFAISLIGTLREYKNFNLYFGDSIYNNSLVKNKIVVLDSNLNDYTKLFLDLDGKKKEDIYNKKVEEFKLEKENRLKEAEENIREKAKDMNVAEAEIKKQIEEAKKIIMEEDNSVDDYFKYVREFTNNILYDNENIQFFFKDSSGAKITNIEDSNIEKQIEEKEFANNEQYYYMYFANSKVNEDGKNYSEELSSIYDLLKYSSEDLIRFYRIPKELQQGDLLYDAFKERKEASSILNRKIAITAILGVFILVFAFIIYKRRKNNYTNYIEDLLIKIPIDIRAIIFLYSLNILNSLIFNVIPYYGNDSYSNGVILRAYILIIIDYYFLKDLILILENKRKKGKVLTLKIYKYLSKIIKDSEFIKTNKFKFISIIFLSALALFCLWLESFVFLSYVYGIF